MTITLPSLPIDSILPAIKTKLGQNQSLVLAAEPGSGKTTIVPLALLDAPWLNGKKIIMLEPRRLAARMAATRMSELSGSPLGKLVGYRIRFENKTCQDTRIEVVTEGIFTRMIQNDPELHQVGLVLFDEFHLRSIQSDLALALCLDVLELREDLKIMIMSATMESSRVAALLGGAPVIRGTGRCFPVETHYLSRSSNQYPVPRAVQAIEHSLAVDRGDILVFLPGAGEIRAVDRQITADVHCLPLYGNLPQKQQDLVFGKRTKRRVILATPIAETSLTIEGVSVVIDCGLMKVPLFSPATGLTTLQTVSISKASAEQRAGRAGRLGPGTCYRLWTENEHHSRPDFLAPEIIGADLAPLLLELLRWGTRDPEELRWLDPPRKGSVQQARDLLQQLEITTGRGNLTPIGKQLAELPLHPRLALMLLKGRSLGHGPLACHLAALLQNRDLLYGNRHQQGADIGERLDILNIYTEKGAAMVRARGTDPALCGRILKEARQYQRILSTNGAPSRKDFQEAGTLLAIAYPDRIAMRRPGAKQHILASGRGVLLPEGDPLNHAEFLVAAHVDGGKKQGRIFLAAPLTREELVSEHGHLLHLKEQIRWHGDKVTALSIQHLGSLEITSRPLTTVAPQRIKDCLMEGIERLGIQCLNWQKKARELQSRLETAHGIDPEKWPDVSDQGLLTDLSWLAPYLDSIKGLKELGRLDIYPILLSRLSWRRQQDLERLLPSHYLAPSGSRIKLQYHNGGPPILAVRLQEMFGATETPSLYEGRISALLHLLSPARRPVQVTRDLASFWRTTYPAVKKELAGRYPKHYWPEDPLMAQATARSKPRK